MRELIRFLLQIVHGLHQFHYFSVGLYLLNGSVLGGFADFGAKRVRYVRHFVQLALLLGADEHVFFFAFFQNLKMKESDLVLQISFVNEVGGILSRVE